MSEEKVYIVKGVVAEGHCHEDAEIGDVEWQFGNGPPGNRGHSYDYTDLEEGLRAHSGKQFVWVEEANDEN